MLRAQDKRLQLGRLENVIPRYVPDELVAFGVATTAGTAVASHASAHTKGSFVELEDSTPIDCDGFYVNILLSTVADYLVDIAIGAGDTVIVSDILLTGAASNAIVQEVVDFYVPIPLPAGTRISARCQATPGNKSCFISGNLARGDFHRAMRCSRATTYGADTSDTGGVNVDSGGVADTKGAYSELTAATTSHIRRMLVCIGNKLNTGRTDSNFLCDIAKGPATEVVVVPDLYFRPNSSTDTLRPHTFERNVFIPSGTRLAARGACGITDATDRLFDVVVIGFD